MLGTMVAISTLAMVAGFLIQNIAEWRAGGPKIPNTALTRSILPEMTDGNRTCALIIISVAVTFLCFIGLISNSVWITTAIASSLIANAVSQLAASLISNKIQPGTTAGLLFMLPTSLWVILAMGADRNWLPIVTGPFLSIPILISVWWLADFVVQNRQW